MVKLPVLVKTIIVFFIFIIPHQVLLGQTTEYRRDQILDLDFVFKNLKKSASYSTQPENHERLNLKYEDLKRDFSKIEYNPIDKYIKLYGLVDQLIDYHNRIQENTIPESINTADTNAGRFGRSKINLDSLELILSSKKQDDVEGIYYSQGAMITPQGVKIAIRQINNESKYEGIILNSVNDYWSRGKIILLIVPGTNDNLRLFWENTNNKSLVTMVSKIRNASIKTILISKRSNEIVKNEIDYRDSIYFKREYDNNVQYVKLGSFSASNNNIQKAKEFSTQLSTLDGNKSTIIDLRNNGGGGDRNSDIFLNVFKNFKGKIYVLMNAYTASNAEQFIIKLRKHQKVNLIGERSAGVLTYGVNRESKVITPSNQFRLIFTDLKDNWKDYSPYEGIGISPDIILEHDKKWIEETLRIIKTKD